MIPLTTRQIIALHEELIRETGGAGGLRDEGLLDSALTIPFQSFERRPSYRSLQQKAARLGLGPVQNYPFVDGSKRQSFHRPRLFQVFFPEGGIAGRLRLQAVCREAAGS